MKKIDHLLNEYGRDHQNSTNQLIHKVCVPLIMFSFLGLLWAIPIPEIFSQIPFLNFSTIIVVACLAFYLSLDIKFALVMLAGSSAMLFGVSHLATTPYLVSGCVVTFVVAWIGQFVGHKIEGKKPSFLKDLQFLLIGPLWVAKGLLR